MAIVPFWTVEGTVDLALLRPQDMTAEIIGSTLAKINRFNGRTPQPWSVASHSVLVSYLVRLELAPWALLHDAHEAYLGDITFPAVELLKHAGPRSEIGEAITSTKGRLDRAIGKAWGVSVRSMSRDIRWADLIALQAEAKVLLGVESEAVQAEDVEALAEAAELIPDLIVGWEASRDLWLARVAHFTNLGLMSPPGITTPSSAVLAG
jgi:hypothetical protein